MVLFLLWHWKKNGTTVNNFQLYVWIKYVATAKQCQGFFVLFLTNKNNIALSTEL